MVPGGGRSPARRLCRSHHATSLRDQSLIYHGRETRALMLVIAICLCLGAEAFCSHLSILANFDGYDQHRKLRYANATNRFLPCLRTPFALIFMPRRVARHTHISVAVQKRGGLVRARFLQPTAAMHYLTELADKLVTAYQDRDNLSHWVSKESREANRLVLAETLRDVLEQEVAKGNLSYHYISSVRDYPQSEDVFRG